MKLAPGAAIGFLLGILLASLVPVQTSAGFATIVIVTMVAVGLVVALVDWLRRSRKGGPGDDR